MHWIALQPQPEPRAGPAPPPASTTPVWADVATALGWWALQFSPYVARVDGTLVLEVSGSERLFGGRDALLHQLLWPAGLPALDHAQGATSRVALARLWCAAPSCAVDRLPLQSLVVARPHLPTFERLGCRTWGQLRALPRGGLVRRFGAELLDALDAAYGTRPEVYPWLTLPDVFDMPLELSAAVESAPALLFGARRLLSQLLLWLRARQAGVLALRLGWVLDARRSNALHVDAHHDGAGQGRLELHTAEPTQDMAHLQRLLCEQLARVQLPAPVHSLHLRTLQVQRLSGASHSLLLGDVRSGDSLHQMLERVAARLGAEQVRCVQPHASHVPEHMQRWQTWQSTDPSAPRSSAVLPPDADLLPTWLLPAPQALPLRDQQPCYHGPLTLLAGPQRLETGWLEGQPVLRDYFIARSAHAGLLWIFRERLQAPARWYLHGVFG